MDLQSCSFWGSLSGCWLCEGDRVLQLWLGLRLISGAESDESWTNTDRSMAFVVGNGPVVAVVWVWAATTTPRIFPRSDQDWRRDEKIPEELGWRREPTSVRLGDIGSPVAPALVKTWPPVLVQCAWALPPRFPGVLRHSLECSQKYLDLWFLNHIWIWYPSHKCFVPTLCIAWRKDTWTFWRRILPPYSFVLGYTWCTLSTPRSISGTLWPWKNLRSHKWS